MNNEGNKLLDNQSKVYSPMSDLLQFKKLNLLGMNHP